ncbi:putative UPF0481 protein [Tanacetum coccineum]
MDLLLLENQVPFFVLQALFDCTMGKVSYTLSNVLDTHLAPYIMLFHSLLPERISTTYVDSDHDHVLGYLHKRYQLVVAKSSNPIHAEESKIVEEKGIHDTYTTFHSIVELDRSGINFKPHQEMFVLVNKLGSNQEAADMINKICKNMIATNFCYTQEFKEIDKYYNALWPKHIAWLRRACFNNPWNAIALLAAIILFSLTVVQTVYAIKAK